MTATVRAIEELKRKAVQDEDVLAVICFGSYAREQSHSDVDICLVMFPRRYEAGRGQTIAS